MTTDSWDVRVVVPDFDEWVNQASFEAVLAIHTFISDCRENGPPPLADLIEMEQDYRFRYLIPGSTLIVDFIAITYERVMLIKGID